MWKLALAAARLWGRIGDYALDRADVWKERARRWRR